VTVENGPQRLLMRAMEVLAQFLRAPARTREARERDEFVVFQPVNPLTMVFALHLDGIRADGQGVAAEILKECERPTHSLQRSLASVRCGML